MKFENCRDVFLKDVEVFHGMIMTEGIFEGEKVYAPMFHEKMLCNEADDVVEFTDQTTHDFFKVTEEDVFNFPELKGVYGVRTHSNDVGDFYCVELKTKDQYENELAHLNEEAEFLDGVTGAIL
jgi:hypothetical protein